MSLDEFGRRYLRLTLALHRHLDGYVDAYYGPPELKAEVDAAEPPALAALQAELDWLRAHVPAEDAARARHLHAIFRAMACTLRLLAGERPEYLDEVAALYDIQPRRVDESVFERAHRALAELLPGAGALADRLEAWRKTFELAPETLPPALDLVRAETRRRTHALVDLVPGETVEVRLTRNQPWSAYNWYLGQARSLIEFNTDLPVSALDVLGLFAHEAYPGHHTEAQLKERHLYAERGYAEMASALLHAPAAVIAEGIATTALEVIFPDDSHYAWTAGTLLPACGRAAEDPERLRQIARARQDLRHVSGNAAILFHTGQLDAAQTVDYLRQFGLGTEARARQSFRFITNPLFRAYIFTYTEGYDLIARAADRVGQLALFRRLLTEPLLPTDLAALAA